MEQRLEVISKCPNPFFERLLLSWLADAERRDSKSQYKLREALHALKSFPLPIASGKECGILRGFGTKLCAQIDEELKKRQHEPIVTMRTYQQEVAQVVRTVQKAKRKAQASSKTSNSKKISKKLQKAMDEEEERHRQVTMSPCHFRIWLLVDTQETSGKNKRILDQTRSYLTSLKLSYEVRRLTVGDFMWIARDEAGNELVLPYIVERKRMDDLASSVRDGRFHEQKHRLRQCGVPNVIYLVEDYGDNEQLGLPLESLQQAMINTQIHGGFQIVRTESHFDSMVYLQGVTQMLTHLFKDKLLISVDRDELREFNPRDRTMGLLKFKTLYDDSARNALLTVREVFVQQLLQLHSLSLEKALAIVGVYATPRILLDAYTACESVQKARSMLANLLCGELQRPIGEKISQSIYDFYNSKF